MTRTHSPRVPGKSNPGLSCVPLTRQIKRTFPGLRCPVPTGDSTAKFQIGRGGVSQSERRRRAGAARTLACGEGRFWELVGLRVAP